MSSVLDFGCGTGGFLRFLQEQGTPSIYGFDASGGQVAVAQRDFPEVTQCTSLTEYRSQNPNMPRPDLITLWDVIEHLRDPRRALLEIREACSPDTLVFFSTPNALSEYVKLYLRKALRVPHSFIPWEHVLYFSQTGLRLLLEIHGFEVVQSVAAACYRRPAGPVELIRRVGFATSAPTKYSPQLAVICRLRQTS